MRTILSIGLCFTLIGCGFDSSQNIHPAFNGSDRSISVYRERFIEQALAYKGADLSYSRSLPMNFVNLGYHYDSGGIVGYCITYPGGDKEIQIDPNFWEFSNDAEKEELVFHELGHCILLRTHKTTLNSNGYPVSIMSPDLIDGSYYAYWKTRYRTLLRRPFGKPKAELKGGRPSARN